MAAQLDHADISLSWLTQFSTALAALDVQGATECFLSHGYLRDILVFTWSNRTLQGHTKIASYIQGTLGGAGTTDFKLDDRRHLSPSFSPTTGTIVSGFTFETAVGPGQGYFYLGPSPSGEWKALSVLMTLGDIRGHEESGPELGIYGGHTLAWEDVDRERRAKVEQDPHVLIVGGGQTGLNVAARFKGMNIPALLIEKEARVGDVWRKRYPTLTLHSPRTQHAMLYKPYPQNWPIFTSRGKLAQWLEHYADSEDLVIWTKSQLLPTPKYDADSKRWTVVIDRDGEHVTVHPKHIVMAAGTLGSPLYPAMKEIERFKGTILHSAHFQGAAPFSGKRVVVVGAGNSAADVCQDLVFHGAQSVTMIQRSSTCVMAAKNSSAAQQRLWPEGVPTDIADLRATALPNLLMKQILRSRETAMWEAEKETHAGLQEAGFKITMGPEGAGPFLLMFEKFGGIDVGCAELIRQGKVKVKHGVEPTSYTEDSIVFSDGSALPADVVIYATSYRSIRDDLRPLFTDAVIDQTSFLWGLDEEGELNGCYRPSGYPGLWFAAGNFAISRFFSKQLALQIKAIELGLYTE
ncbi:FAD/NAD-P-binding domain-containing protein [Mycena sanguinolenta]|nr:FAD/NAD-P-binding domain-containing protein [Mycena sanguinolenta]